jgi:hypothetical protein
MFIFRNIRKRRSYFPRFAKISAPASRAKPPAESLDPLRVTGAGRGSIAGADLPCGAVCAVDVFA